MPKGKVSVGNRTYEYDSVEVRGDVTIIKTAHDHDVISFGTGQGVFSPGEYHRTPFGSCKPLSDWEIQQELDKYK